MPESIQLPARPIDVVNNLLAARGYDQTPVPVNAASLKGNVWKQNSAVSRSVVPESEQEALRVSDVDTTGGQTGWMVAYFEVVGLTPDRLLDVFDRVVALSLEQETERNGGTAPSATVETVIAQTAATETVKRIWTTHVVEAALGAKLGNAVAPADYVEAVSREKDSVDIQLENGEKFQVKSEAGSAEAGCQMIWTPNFEDYFDKTEIEARFD